MDRTEFIDKYVSALTAGTAGILVGAGLSARCGYMDWKDLMRTYAKRLGLDIEHEDPIEVAQWCVQERGDRGGLINELVGHFCRKAELTECHKLLVRLPWRTVWTTNYDTVLEDAFRSVGKMHEVKKQDANFAYHNPSADVVIMKMHGDINSNPEDIVITLDDYERWESKYYVMANVLSTSLAQNTFLFLGFSFRDPNLRRTLGHLRLRFGDTSREHYAILRKPNGNDVSNIRFRLFVRDLQRYNIQTVVITDYGEVPLILDEIRRKYLQKAGFETLYGQEPRNRFIIENLQRLCDNPRGGLKIYNHAVFSIFAASLDFEYRKLEPGGGAGDHMPLIMLERQLLQKLVTREDTQFKLLLWPPPPDPGHAVRYRTLMQWLQKEGDRPNVEVRCTAYYRDNRLIIPGEFAIEALYAPKEGWSKNTVYYSERNIGRLAKDFDEIFQNSTFAQTKEDVLKFLQERAAESEEMEVKT